MRAMSTKPAAASPGLALLLAAFLAACTVTPPTGTQPPVPTDPPTTEPTGQPTAPPATFDNAALDATIAAFAAAGIEVRVRPADTPLVPVTQPTRLGLLRFQARNLALEATVGGGNTGAELDAFTTTAGGEPLAALISGWLATAETDASRAAATLTDTPAGTTDGHTTATFPGAVLLMFVADLLGPAPATASLGAQVALAGALTAQGSGDFCAEVSTYLSAVLAGVLDAETTPNPPWLANVIDQLALLEPDPAQLRTAVGALALLTYATSIARPWAANLSAAPAAAHYRVGNSAIEGINAFYLNVNTGDSTIAEEAAECAALAGADLAGGAPDLGDDAPIHVQWVTVELAPHTTSLEGDMELELQPGAQVMSAKLEYETRSESEDAHARGPARSATATVTAIVQRLEISALQNVVRSLLSGDMGAAQPTVAAELDRLDRTLLDLLYPRGTARVTITWHEPPETPPPPSPTPDRKKEFCDRYVALLRWLVSQLDTDNELTRPWAAEIARRTADMRPYAPQELLEHVDLVYRVYNTYATAPDPVQIPIVGPDAAKLPVAAAAMDGYCGIIRGQPPYEDIP